MSTDHLLEERYGRTRGRRLRGRVIGWAGGAAVAVVILAWVVWAGLDGQSASVDANDTAHQVIDSRSVEVDFDLTVPRGESARCIVQALNDGFAVVGWKLIEVPPSDQATRSLTETVRTSELASTGLIYNCWLP